MKSRPLLTLAVPTFNRWKCLSKTIEKVKAFNPSIFKELKVLVADNCSDDKTQFYCQGIDEEWFCYHRNKENIGATRNLFKLNEICDTEYIWWMGDDDNFSEQNVWRVIEKLKELKPEILVVNRLVESDKEIICNNVLKLYLKESYSGTLNSFMGKTGILTGIGCISTLIFKPYNDLELNNFFDLETSYPQLGYLIKNFGEKQGYFDIDNIISTYTENSRPNTYESGSLDKHLAKMATGIPKMYTYLLKDGRVPANVILSSSEYCWGRGVKKSACLYHFLLYMNISLSFRFSFSEMKNLFDFYYELKKFIYCFVVLVVWILNQLLYVFNKILRFFGVDIIKIKVFLAKKKNNKFFLNKESGVCSNND